MKTAQQVIEKVYALINPLHGEIDRQLLDQRLPDDLPDDAELDVLIARKQERDLTAAVLLIEQYQRLQKADTAIQHIAEIYNRVNSIGSPDSAEDPNDQFAKGVNHAVDQALNIIDDLRSRLDEPRPAADPMRHVYSGDAYRDYGTSRPQRRATPTPGA